MNDVLHGARPTTGSMVGVARHNVTNSDYKDTLPSSDNRRIADPRARCSGKVNI